MTNLQTSNEEIWKDIQGFEGYYQVSNYGRVKSLNRHSILKTRWDGKTIRLHIGRLLAPGFDNHYHFVFLCKDETLKKKWHIHRLVGVTFIPNPENKKEINHIDGNKLNNHVFNLEWCTRGENNTHAIRTGLKHPLGLGCFNEKSHRSRPVSQFDMNGLLIKTFPSSREAERHGFTASKITAVCKNRRPHHKGFVWMYA